MAASAAPSLLPGQSPPLLVISPTNQSAVVLIVTALGLGFALLSLLIRAYVRFAFSPSRFERDDQFILAATVFSIFQNAAVFVGVHRGLGRTIDHITPRHLVEIQKAGYADDILYIVAVWLTKLSVSFFFLRLSPRRGHVQTMKIISVIAVVTAIISIMIVALQCNLSHPWIHINSHNAQCTGLFARWQVVAAFDIILEVVLFATSIYLVQPLQMSISRKAPIVVAFALRLLIIVPIVFRLHYLSKALNSPDFTLSVTDAMICKQVEICYAIVSATIPCLRPFMTATTTNYGAPAEGPRTKKGYYARSYGPGDSTNESDRKKGGHVVGGLSLASLTSKLGARTYSDKHNASSKMNGDSAGQPYWPGSHSHHTANVVGPHTARDGRRSDSGESRQMIIRKDVEYAVEYDPRHTESETEYQGVGTAR